MPERTPSSATSGSTVLVVEDDPINVRIFRKVLERRGNFNVIHSEDVSEIHRLTASGEIDIVLMDVSLTNSAFDNKPVDGLWIAKTIKTDPQTQAIPVVLVTANAMVGDRERFLEVSLADEYVPKPIIDHGAFIALIQQQLADRALPTDAADALPNASPAIGSSSSSGPAAPPSIAFPSIPNAS
ncbi:MAG: response regulator [Geitlerinemataceae cyanobacterium]